MAGKREGNRMKKWREKGEENQNLKNRESKLNIPKW